MTTIGQLFDNYTTGLCVTRNPTGSALYESRASLGMEPWWLLSFEPSFKPSFKPSCNVPLLVGNHIKTTKLGMRAKEATLLHIFDSVEIKSFWQRAMRVY